MTKTKVDERIREAAGNVLETMFFSELTPCAEETPQHSDPLACLLHCRGAEEGVFTVALDRTALRLLCEGFYGEDQVSVAQEHELICELTNMLAGSTLSALAPERYCELTPPQICTFARHLEYGSRQVRGEESTCVYLQLDGGVLSVACSLREAA